MRREFRDRVVVVTGAASGIGRALCGRFGKAGAIIAALDMDREGLARLEGDMEAIGVRARGYECDVSDNGSCREAVGAVIRDMGGVDVLVNNAGITQRSPFVSTGIGVYRRVMDVNFFGSVSCSMAAAESLIARRGMIIVTSSIAGLVPLIGRTGYCASKHALHGFFRTLRAELSPQGVGVLIVCPGFTRTNLQTRALDGDGSVTAHPQSRVGGETTPEEVAEKVFRAARRGKKLLVLSGTGVVTRWMNALAPNLYETVMARKLRREIVR
ncbi:MAG: SDR family oxidoreductase [Spirochaetes bacterium]|nr:SDR family oxidoreductase [Spirochaetota bacterium]